MLILSFLLCFAFSKIYYHEQFAEGDWRERWVQSRAKSSSHYGTIKVDHGDYYGDRDLDKGLMTFSDNKHYAISSHFDEEFDNFETETVLQFSMKNTQDMRYPCGGYYLKFGPKETLEDLKKLDGNTEYSVMFGPDFCGTDQKMHLIIEYNGVNYDWKKTEELKVPERTDQTTHVYSLILRDDNTYQLLFDGEKKSSGKLKNDWDFGEAKNSEDLYHHKFGWVGFEVWQVNAGSVIDNIMVTDDRYEAKKARDLVLRRVRKEREMLEADKVGEDL